MTVASCTGTDPQILAGAIQESEFMNSEAKLNTKNVQPGRSIIHELKLCIKYKTFLDFLC